MKWAPEHFPVGTVIEVHDLPSQREITQIFTVQKLWRNGADSYVIETTQRREPRSYEDPNKESYETFHTQFVSKIITRGSGPVLLDHGWFGASRKSIERAQKDVDLAEMRAQWELAPKPRKGYYTTYSLPSLVHLHVSKVVTEGIMIDHSKVIVALVQQPWCKLYGLGPNRVFNVTQINKKRFAEWFAQNQNRFIRPLADAVKQERDEMELQAELDEWDAEEDRNCPLPHADGDEETENYSGAYVEDYDD